LPPAVTAVFLSVTAESGALAASGGGSAAAAADTSYQCHRSAYLDTYQDVLLLHKGSRRPAVAPAAAPAAVPAAGGGGAAAAATGSAALCAVRHVSCVTEHQIQAREKV
jgi:hypothetical protein